MRSVQLKRRGVAAMVAFVTLAFAGSFAGLGSASASVPGDDSTGPVALGVADEALYAEPSATATTLSRGASKVTVSRTADLTRQMLSVSWSGMEPSGFYSGARIRQVVVMQCRGTNPDRSDCWRQNAAAVKPTFYQPAEPTQWFTNLQTSILGASLQIPFRRADGSYHARQTPTGPWIVPALDQPAGDLPPVDDWTPATNNPRLGVTEANGAGQLQTWVNTKFENSSLGCSDTQPCSLVVIPVHGQPCRTDAGLPLSQQNQCKSSATNGSNAASFYWQLMATWNERFVFKLDFAPRATVCDQREDGVTLTGSEMVGEAMRRWVSARCQPSSPAALDYTLKWEPESRTLLGADDPIQSSGYGSDGVLTTEPAEADSTVVTERKPAYAPVAVSGFAIGYFWEYQTGINQGKPVPDIKLNARLVAKMLTQSYPGKYNVAAGNQPVNPNAPTNPAHILSDPEFRQLNPDAGEWAGYSGSVGTQMALPGANNDVMLALTRWLWADPAARAFLQGKADEWGMKVNKAYLNWPMPRNGYELRDGWLLPEGQGDWTGFSPQQLWAPQVNNWAEGSDSLMTAWPRSQYPARTLPDPTLRPKRDEPQAVGLRGMLALSTTSELEKVGMRSALLQNSDGAYVGPNFQGMSYALDGATVDQKSGVWKINYSAMDKRGYPGTMITYAAVPTSTLKGESPKRYADTLRWISTEGQVYGVESGQLPEGYLALTDTMREQTAKVAAAVENQIGKPVIPPGGQDPVDDDEDPTPDDPPTPNNPDDPGQTTAPPQNNGDGTGNGTESNDDNGNQPGGTPTTPGATPSAGTPSKNPPQASGSTKPVSATTQGESLGWLAWGIPALLVAGLAAGVASPGIRLIAQPGHPVRRGLVAGGSYIASLLRRGRRRG